MLGSRYHRAKEKAEARSAGQDLNPAQRLMTEWMQPLSAAIQEMLDKVDEGRFLKDGTPFVNSRGHYQPVRPHIPALNQSCWMIHGEGLQGPA